MPEFCPACGNLVAGGVEHCPACGARMHPKAMDEKAGFYMRRFF